MALFYFILFFLTIWVFAYFIKNAALEERRKDYERRHQRRTTANLYNDSSLPYMLKTNVLTNRELEFFNKLHLIAEKHSLTVFAKIRIADFVYVPNGTKNFYNWFNRISAKHVDFLLCKDVSEPFLAIELDDSTHDKPDRKNRDEIVDYIYNHVGLTCLHIREYDIESLDGLITKHLDSAEQPEGTEQIEDRPEKCPNCESNLIVRESKKNGDKFYGCSNFPKCRYSKPIE